jgi:hypothetical protein
MPIEAPVITTTFPETPIWLELIFNFPVLLCDLCGNFAAFAVKIL